MLIECMLIECMLIECMLVECMLVNCMVSVPHGWRLECMLSATDCVPHQVRKLERHMDAAKQASTSREFQRTIDPY